MISQRQHMHTNHNDVGHQSRSEEEVVLMEVRKGPWTPEEDSTLKNFINHHGGVGHSCSSWNSLAQHAGLKRSGKSCRLRWMNYLRPDIRRGNLTLKEQFHILQLHCHLGNRWSKIAEQLPGRTDNEIKNYWRTRIQKQAKQLNCDVNSHEFRDTIRYEWLPRLLEQIQASYSCATSTITDQEVTTSMNSSTDHMTTTTTTTIPITIPVVDPNTSESPTSMMMMANSDQVLPAHDLGQYYYDYYYRCDDEVVGVLGYNNNTIINWDDVGSFTVDNDGTPSIAVGHHQLNSSPISFSSEQQPFDYENNSWLFGGTGFGGSVQQEVHALNCHS